MPETPSTTSHRSVLQRQLWIMLLALLSGFALSQAFRTITAILAQGLQQDFGISASSLGAFAGLFGLSFRHRPVADGHWHGFVRPAPYRAVCLSIRHAGRHGSRPQPPAMVG